MFGWRRGVAIIRESFTGEASEGWRADLAAIAVSRGHNPRGWREAIRMLSQDYGDFKGGWRDEVAGIARALGMADASSWRGNLRFIREYYEDNPPVSHKYRLYDAEGYALFDADGYALFVRG